ncbi:MAG: patatin-like phospholipase family protein [Gammaproteobacteria bacterium]
MEEALLNALKANKIFSSLDDRTRAEILPKFIQVELAPDEILFYQGDPSNGLFLLVSGKLGALLTSAAAETKMVGHIDSGEAVGESGALTGEHRSLTIKALTECILYKLSSRDFIDLCYQHPDVMFATIHPIITRSRSLLQLLASDKNNKHILILPANKDISLEKFSEKLISFVTDYPNVVLISDYHTDFIRPNIDLDELKNKITELEQGKKKSHKILYLLQSCDSPLARLCFKRADNVYIATISGSTPKIDNSVLEKIQSRRTHLRSDPSLIILHGESTVSPRHTANWLSITSFYMYHHLRIDVTKDYHRLLRFIRGKAVGVVLGGGGTRGWAHLGALKALREEKIPIDMIGGTSVGAIVAACYAIFESYEDTYERFNRLVEGSRGSISWRGLTWPVISVFDAKKFTQSQQDVFNDYCIEDLWLPYFCISSNLATNNEDVHRTGKLWEKTRASSSIPGIIPPMLLNEQLHLDGGLLNNLPVDVMRRFLGNKSKIIAIELNSYSTDKHKYQFPPVLTFKQALLAKLDFTRETYKFPRFIDTFLRGLFIGSTGKSKQNSLNANIFVNLDLNKFRMLHANNKQAQRLIELGYETTMKQLEQSKKKE